MRENIQLALHDEEIAAVENEKTNLLHSAISIFIHESEESEDVIEEKRIAVAKAKDAEHDAHLKIRAVREETKKLTELVNDAEVRIKSKEKEFNRISAATKTALEKSRETIERETARRSDAEEKANKIISQIEKDCVEAATEWAKATKLQSSAELETIAAEEALQKAKQKLKEASLKFEEAAKNAEKKKEIMRKKNEKQEKAAQRIQDNLTRFDKKIKVKMDKKEEISLKANTLLEAVAHEKQKAQEELQKAKQALESSTRKIENLECNAVIASQKREVAEQEVIEAVVRATHMRERIASEKQEADKQAENLSAALGKVVKHEQRADNDSVSEHMSRLNDGLQITNKTELSETSIRFKESRVDSARGQLTEDHSNNNESIRTNADKEVCAPPVDDHSNDTETSRSIPSSVQQTDEHTNESERVSKNVDQHRSDPLTTEHTAETQTPIIITTNVERKEEHSNDYGNKITSAAKDCCVHYISEHSTGEQISRGITFDEEQTEENLSESRSVCTSADKDQCAPSITESSTKNPTMKNIKSNAKNEEDNPACSESICTSASKDRCAPFVTGNLAQTDTSRGITPSEEEQKASDNAARRASRRARKPRSSFSRESNVKRSWEFYRGICQTMNNKHKYEDSFHMLQKDPIYPYLNTMKGMNDEPGKCITQKAQRKYIGMKRSEVAKDLVKKANEALPKLVNICKDLSKAVGFTKIGVGPTKGALDAEQKAERKYEGNILRVTDFCRVFVVLEDIPALLATIELAWVSLGPSIRRVKLSTLKRDNESLPGGYRDCKINLEVSGHICEIQLHLSCMWDVCDVEGYKCYSDWLEYSLDFCDYPSDVLVGIDKKTVHGLVTYAEKKVEKTPLGFLLWDKEKEVLHYLVLAGIYTRHGFVSKAEDIFDELFSLCCDRSDSFHHQSEVKFFQKLLDRSLRKQNKTREANQLAKFVEGIDSPLNEKNEEKEESIWDPIFNAHKGAIDMIDTIIDPEKEARKEMEKEKFDFIVAKELWFEVRQTIYKDFSTPINVPCNE